MPQSPLEVATGQTPCRVLVVDADHRVRASLAGLIGLGDDVEVIGAAGSVDDAVALAGRLHPDIVVIDPRLPDVEAGLGLIRTLRTAEPATRIVVMSLSLSLELTCLASGADAFIDKSTDPATLVDAVLFAAGIRREIAS